MKEGDQHDLLCGRKSVVSHRFAKGKYGLSVQLRFICVVVVVCVYKQGMKPIYKEIIGEKVYVEISFK